MNHDQNFKNLILDYPEQALAFFAAAEAPIVGDGAGITPLRQEQLQERLARREPPGSASSALQLLTRATAIACELRLDLANPGGSEWVNISGGVH